MRTGEITPPGIFGQRGYVIECDPGTRRPLEGGRVLGAVAVQFHLDGSIDVVADGFLPAEQPNFWPSGWISSGTYRWRLSGESAVAAFGEGESAQYVLSEELFR